MGVRMTSRAKSIHRKAKDYRWEGVAELPYKEDDRALFKSITRQVLFADPQLHGELRYFEVAPGGFSTLERHQHMHAVMILRGRGHCLVGEEVRAVETRDHRRHHHGVDAGAPGHFDLHAHGVEIA